MRTPTQKIDPPLPPPHKHMDAGTIVAALKEASAAYYNGQPLKMDDDTYDALQERLRELDPKNPYLTTIGAPPTGQVATLPYPMPSLDKIKPGQDALDRFLTSGHYALSEKLDGLSALWIPPKTLYLRGDGIQGQDISHFAKGIQGLGTSGAVRGELVVPRNLVQTLARSWVNGIIHRKDSPLSEVQKIHFVAYDLLKPGKLTRSQQFEWLQTHGYEVPWWSRVDTPAVEDLKAYLTIRRKESPYDTDGIVVGRDAIPVRPTPGKNPKDAVAFKMPLDDQSAETTVKSVLWAPSSQGYLIPKLEFDPVLINGATIRFCTAHTARNVVQNRLGPGAKIVIRRSGDVIPTIDRVLVGTTAQLPEGPWEWVGEETHIRVLGASPALTTAKLHHFLKTLDIPGAGPAAAAALVEGGLTGPKALWDATAKRLSELLGPKTGETMYNALRKRFRDPITEVDLMIGSSLMPRGVGDTKLRALSALNPDPRAWHNIGSAAGWTTDSLATFKETLPTYEVWRKKELYWLPYPAVTAAVPVATQGVICLTGFRDKDIEEMATKRGYIVASTITTRTTILIVPDGPVKESEKVKTATAKGVRIMNRSDFVQYLTAQ